MSAIVTTPGGREVLVTREFAAPRQLVWDAHTNPELLKRWLQGTEGWAMPVCEMDVRVGGKYRWRFRNEADGAEFGFHGEYMEVQAPAKIVHSEYFDPGNYTGGESFPVGDPAIITMTLEERKGRTVLNVHMLYPSQEARDGAVSSGMTDGMEEGYQRLDAMFADASKV